MKTITCSRLPSAIAAAMALVAGIASLDARPRGFAYTAQGQLFSFDLTNPTAVTPIGPPVGPSVKGIDFRPGTTTLYAIDVTATLAQLYTVNLDTGARTPIGPGFPSSGSTPAAYTLDPALAYGFDFNPTTLQADGSIRIRLVNTAGVNLRLNSDTGSIANVDPGLAYAGGAPADSDVGAAAYTNSDTARAPGSGDPTLLHYIDTLADALVSSANANAGTINSVGPLGVAVSASAGLDILKANGQNRAFAVLDLGAGTYTLHAVDLTTGVAGPSLGAFPAGFQPTAGFAMADLPEPAPPANARGFSYNAAGQLFSFPLDNPSNAIPIGVPVGPNVKGIDFRPGTATLYAVDVTDSVTQLYTVDPATGVRTPVGPGFASAGAVPGNYALAASANYGLDFNPTTLQPDGSIRIRLVNNDGQDLRLNSNTGAIAAVDGPLGYLGGTPPLAAIAAAAYTNSDASRMASVGAPTVLYYVDTLNDNLVNLPSNPNGGRFVAVGSLGAGINIGPNAGFDILASNGTNTGYLVAAPVGTAAFRLHRVDLVTGALSAPIGAFPAGFDPAGGLAIALMPPAPDQQPPSLKIKQPKQTTVTRRKTFNVSGSARDDFAVAQVLVRVGSKQFKPATGTTNWAATVKLARGRNPVRITAIDSAGNSSAPAKVVLIRK